jgi:hypothetical protein
MLVDQAAGDGSASDSPVEVGGGVIEAWREKAQRSMWPPAVVMGAVLGKDGP